MTSQFDPQIVGSPPEVPEPYAHAHAASAMMYEVGGKSYPMRVCVQCKVCNSPYRVQIEDALIAGYGYAAIARSLPEDARINARNINVHRRQGHLPLNLAVRTELIAERVREAGERIEEAAVSVVDQVLLARTVVQRTFERIAAGEIEPDISDGLAAAKLLVQVGQYDGSDIDREGMVQIIAAYMEAVSAEVDPLSLARIGARLRGHPVLEKMAERAQRGQLQIGSGRG